MTLEIRYRDSLEEVPCPANSFMANLVLEDPVHRNRFVAVFNDNEWGRSFLNADGYETVERSFEDGQKLRMAMYFSDDPEILDILRKYAGVKLIECCSYGIEVTVTL